MRKNFIFYPTVQLRCETISYSGLIQFKAAALIFTKFRENDRSLYRYLLSYIISSSKIRIAYSFICQLGKHKYIPSSNLLRNTELAMTCLCLFTTCSRKMQVNIERTFAIRYWYLTKSWRNKITSA